MEKDKKDKKNLVIEIKENKKNYTMEDYYYFIKNLLENKKISSTTYYDVKDLDFMELLNNEELFNNLRNYIVHGSQTDKEYYTFLLSKINNQISKGRFADNLNYYSRLNGITSNDMANRLGLPTSTVNDWYNGVNYPRQDKISALAKILNIPAEFLTQDRNSLNIEISTIGSIPSNQIEFIKNWSKIPNFLENSNKRYFALEIKDNYMENKYFKGDIIIFERLESCDSRS
jgi:transcriptional regulator with XRE-family HTH domain